LLVTPLKGVPAKVLLAMNHVEKLIGIVPYDRHAPWALAGKRGMKKPIAARWINKLATRFIQRSPQTDVPLVALLHVLYCHSPRATAIRSELDCIRGS
jgi:hypothetical protein